MRELVRRAWFLLRQNQHEADLAEEIAFHRDMKEQELRDRGVSDQEIGAAVRQALGNELLAREEARDVWIAPSVRALAQDFRFAVRLLRKDFTLTIAATTALALGIAASTTVFTIVNAMVLRGLPVDHPDRIVAFARTSDRVPGVSYQDVADWRAAGSFVGLGAYSPASMLLGDESRSSEVFSGSYISWNAFRLLGIRPVLGREFHVEDDRRGAARVVVLGYSVWKTRYGSDPGIVGRTIRVNSVPAVVIGVMPDGFRFPLVDNIWQPLALMPGLDTHARDSRALRAFGRLQDGVSIREAQSELDTIAARLRDEYPGTNAQVRPEIEPFTGTPSHPMFWTLFGAVGFVLCIACSNVAILLLARASNRSREISVRVALGATRWRIVRQLLVESVLLSAGGGLLGLLLAALGVRFFAWAVDGIPFAYWYDDRWTMDARVFVFAALVSLLTPLLFGLAPARQLARTRFSVTIAGGRVGSAVWQARRWTAALVATQLAFTLTLLAGAGLMMRSMFALYEADRAISTSGVLAMRLRLPVESYGSVERRSAFYDSLQERFGRVRSIASATIATSVPFAGAPVKRLAIRGRATAPDQAFPTVSTVHVGSRYFETLGLHIVRGRPFGGVDGASGHESAIVSERFVSLFFPHDDAIGQRIALQDIGGSSGAPAWLTIVGVSRTVRQQFMREIDPVVYLPLRANPSPGTWLLVRAHGEPDDVAALVRAELRGLDPELAVYGVTPLETLMTQSRWGHRVFGGMMALFAGVALVMAALGLYAVTAYSVTQRRQEIGVRMALGAGRGEVVWLFLARAAPPIGVGLLIGGLGAFGIGRLVRSLLVQTSPTDPLTLLAIATLLGCVIVAACAWPATRAAALNPILVLRHE